MSETIRRVASHTKGFTIMVNEALQRPDLSARAKGLYAYLMTLPDDWVIRKPELYSHFTEGREAMETAFKELASAGYIETSEVRHGGKFAEYRHTIHESSTAPQKTVNGLPVTGKPLTENPVLLSTDLPSPENKTPPNPLKGDSDQILSYLNEKAEKHFLPIPTHFKIIQARLKDGFTVEDCKRVIDSRVLKWGKDPKMREYLRPSTLFAPSHFDAYLNDDSAITEDEKVSRLLAEADRITQERKARAG